MTAQTEQLEESELPEQLGINLTRESDMKMWRDIQENIADKRDTVPGDVAKTDVLRVLMRNYEFRKLKNDKRIQDAQSVVAEDYGVEPSDVPLPELLKLTAGAYCGYELATDWDLSENGEEP